MSVSQLNLLLLCSWSLTFRDSHSRLMRALSASFCVRSAMSFLTLSRPAAESNSWTISHQK